MRNPETFRKLVPMLLKRGRLGRGQERELWTWRAHALEQQNPVANFCWLMSNPANRHVLTGRDEQQAGFDMQQNRYVVVRQVLDAAPPKNVDPLFYRRHLRSPLWTWIRKLKLRESKFTCAKCKRRLPRGQLDVHHKTYANLGREKLTDLEVLCWECHKKEHGRIEVSETVKKRKRRRR